MFFHGRRRVSVTGESRIADAGGDAFDKPIRVVAKIQLVRFIGLSLVFLIKFLVQFKNENYQTKVC